MIKKSEKLTQTKIEKLKKVGEYPVDETSGLFFVIAPDDQKRWILKYESHFRRTQKILGSYPELSLSDARQAAADYEKIGETPPSDHLPPERANQFFRDLKKCGDSIPSQAMKFMILTDSTPQQVSQAQWLDFELDLQRWLLPGEVKPLSEPVMKILQEMRKLKINRFVFSGSAIDGNQPESIFDDLLGKMNYSVRADSFKKTFDGWASTGRKGAAPVEVYEFSKMDLNEQKSVSNFRKYLFDDWSDHCHRTMLFSGS